MNIDDPWSENLDDWAAEDWENFWSEPEETVASDDAHYFDDLGDGEDLPGVTTPNPAHYKQQQGRREDPSPQPQAQQQPQPTRQNKNSKEEAEKCAAAFLKDPKPKYAAQGSAYFRKAKMPEAAIKLILRAKTILQGNVSNKDRSIMLTTVAAAYADLGRYEIALVSARRALELWPDRSHPWFVAGKSAAKLELHSKADSYFDQARKLQAEGQ